MKHRLTVAVAALSVAAVSGAPAYAKPTPHAKPKPRPIRVSYKLNLPPDPTINATEATPGAVGCNAVLPTSVDNHKIVLPGPGTLDVVLDSPDPTNGSAAVGPEWDLFLLDTDGSLVDSDDNVRARKETTDGFKKGQTLTIQSCNLTGEPNATVTWTFTPR